MKLEFQLAQGHIRCNDHDVNLSYFHKSLLVWGADNFREFPWRSTSDPYCILMAEVMLHRTQAKQVAPIYESFLRQYPDLVSLSQANEADIKQLLYSLGLHWRVKLIHDMVEELMQRFTGTIPSDRNDLVSLPGVSDYIASSVRCFAWNGVDPLIDTNTVRIIARIFGIEVRDSLRRNRKFKSLIGAMVNLENPRAYNYALLDLANKVCFKAQEPDCPKCPLQSFCKSGFQTS